MPSATHAVCWDLSSGLCKSQRAGVDLLALYSRSHPVGSLQEGCGTLLKRSHLKRCPEAKEAHKINERPGTCKRTTSLGSLRSDQDWGIERAKRPGFAQRSQGRNGGVPHQLLPVRAISIGFGA